GRLAEAGHARRVHVKVSGQEPEAAVPGDSARAVQEEQRRTRAGLLDLERRTARPELDHARLGLGHRAAPAGIFAPAFARRAAGRGQRLGPPALLVVGVDVLQLGQDLLTGQPRGAIHELRGRRADVTAEQHVTHPQGLRELFDLLAHRLGRAREDVALVHELLPGLVDAHVLRGVAELGHDAGAHRRLGALARRFRRARIQVETLVEEVVDVRPPLLLALRVGLADADLLEERRRVRVVVGAQRGAALPVTVHHVARALVTREREIAVVVVVLRAEVPGLDRAEPGDPDRWVRLLDRPRPEVDVTQLGVLAAECER